MKTQKVKTTIVNNPGADTYITTNKLNTDKLILDLPESKSLIKGKIVNVYQKPLTDEDYEGEAKLVKKCNQYGTPPEGYEFWNVCFISDGFDTIRLIKIQ